MSYSFQNDVLHAWMDSHEIHDLSVEDHDDNKCRPASEQHNNV